MSMQARRDSAQLLMISKWRCIMHSARAALEADRRSWKWLEVASRAEGAVATRGEGAGEGRGEGRPKERGGRVVGDTLLTGSITDH